MALVGLNKFSLQTFTKNLDMNVNFSIANLSPSPFTVITPKNRFKWFDVKVIIYIICNKGNKCMLLNRWVFTYYGCYCCVSFTYLCLLQVPTVPSTVNCIQWSGNGTVIIQVCDHGSKLEHTDIVHLYKHVLCACTHTHTHTHRAPLSTMAAAVVMIMRHSQLI